MTDIIAPAHPLPLLADPAGYVACPWDLTADAAQRAYWLGLFRRHFPSLLEEAAREAAERGAGGAAAQQRLAAARAEFERYLDEIAANPARDGRLDILTICYQRERVLRRHGIADPYRLAKARENELALACLPAVLAEIDALPESQHLERLTLGVFAGNIFDLGATETAELFKEGTVDFHVVRRRLVPRPWLIDDLDAWQRRMNNGPPHRCACLFVDNAGSDVILGMIPLARELLRRGTRVILTANSTPTLNDVTHGELGLLLKRIAAWDATLAAALRGGELELVASGNGVPLIDLTRVAPALAQAVRRRGVDLVVLEGMGRAIESNLHVPFTCDVLKIAMVKDRGVADALGGKVYDLVLRFEAG